MANKTPVMNYLAIGVMSSGTIGVWLVPTKEQAVEFAENSCGEKVKVYAIINNFQKLCREAGDADIIKLLSRFLHEISNMYDAIDWFNEAICDLVLEAFTAGIKVSGKLAIDSCGDYSALCVFLFNNSKLDILEKFLESKSKK